MKAKVLALFYVDVNGNKGDSIRVRETVRFMNEKCNLELICINAQSLKGLVRGFHVPRTRRGMTVVWNLLSMFYGIYACIQLRPQVIYADVCPGSLSPVILSKLMGKPLIVELHTPAGAQDVALYRAKSSIRVTLAQWIERITVRRARLVIASQGWADLVKESHQVSQDRIFVLPLAVNPNTFHPMDKRECRQRLDLPTTAPIGIFVGNIGPWQGLDTLLRAAPMILKKHPNAIFLIVGDGASRSYLIQQSQELNVNQSFRFVGPVSYEQVPYYIGAADVGFSLFPKDRGVKGGVSAHKTLNYLACGRPLIISEMDEMADFITDHNAGKVIKPDDTQLLTDAVLWIFRKNQGEDGELMRRGAECLGKLLPTWEDRISQIMIRMDEII